MNKLNILYKVNFHWLHYTPVTVYCFGIINPNLHATRNEYLFSCDTGSRYGILVVQFAERDIIPVKLP